MPILNLQDASIYYEIHGDSSNTITLVNGHTRSSADFQAMVRFLTQYDMRCLIFDNRGSGKTIHRTKFKLEDMAFDVLDLWEHLGIQSSILLGISMGGLISQKIAALAQDKVSKLVLVSTASEERFIIPGRSDWTNDIDKIRDKMSRFFSESFLERNKFLFESMVKQTQKAIVENNFVERAKDQRDAFWGENLTSELRKIQCPTLIIHGAEDRAVSPEGAVALMNAIQGSKLHMIENVGHLLLAECPKTLYEIVLQFVSRS